MWLYSSNFINHPGAKPNLASWVLFAESCSSPKKWGLLFHSKKKKGKEASTPSNTN